jgi:DNA-binding transcriptional MerR regulator
MSKRLSGKKYTARELSKQFGCTRETIHAHAVKLFGPGEPRKTRYFDEAQTTVMLESIKTSIGKGRLLNDSFETVRKLSDSETELTDEYRLAMLYKQDADLMREAAGLEKKLRLKAEERAVHAEAKVVMLTAKNERIQDDLRHANQKLELAGWHLTDREDMLSTYRSQAWK